MAFSQLAESVKAKFEEVAQENDQSKNGKIVIDSIPKAENKHKREDDIFINESMS